MQRLNPHNPSFAMRLVEWQQAHGRHDMPWQHTRDPYRVWLSEIMLQQTQVQTVLGYNGFWPAFPRWLTWLQQICKRC
jgi:A/G-specific adenine glycosylase